MNGTIAGLSLKTFLFGVAVLLFLGIYVGIVLFGENSLPVLNRLQTEKATLIAERHKLREENRRLQKRYFELKQLIPEEER